MASADEEAMNDELMNRTQDWVVKGQAAPETLRDGCQAVNAARSIIKAGIFNLYATYIVLTGVKKNKKKTSWKYDASCRRNTGRRLHVLLSSSLSMERSHCHRVNYWDRSLKRQL